MSIDVIRRYRAELAPDLTLHVFDSVVADVDDEEVDGERETYIEIVDERGDGYEVDTISLKDDSVVALHKVLGEMIAHREGEDDECVWCYGESA